MSNLLFHWQREIYQHDRSLGFDYHLNQNSARMLEVEIGESVWAFTRRNDGAYVLAAHLVVDRKATNPSTYAYGRFRVIGNPDTTTYFDLELQTDITSLIKGIVQARADILGRSFQGHSGVRTISSAGQSRLRNYAADLRPIDGSIS